LLHNELAIENLHSTRQIILWLQNRPGRISLRQQFVFLPVEIAVIALGIHISKLQQTFASHHTMSHSIFGCSP